MYQSWKMRLRLQSNHNLRKQKQMFCFCLYIRVKHYKNSCLLISCRLILRQYVYWFRNQKSLFCLNNVSRNIFSNSSMQKTTNICLLSTLLFARLWKCARQQKSIWSGLTPKTWLSKYFVRTDKLMSQTWLNSLPILPMQVR